MESVSPVSSSCPTSSPVTSRQSSSSSSRSLSCSRSRSHRSPQSHIWAGLLLLGLLGTSLQLVHGSALQNGNQASANDMQEVDADLDADDVIDDGKLKTCIDDTDCRKLANGYDLACFQYICYPWKDDSKVSPDEKRTTCRRKSDCPDEQECFRHYDKRSVYRGVCFDEVTDCEAPSDCAAGDGCCNGYCCEQKYHARLTDLPCLSHFGCQDLGLGEFCCPNEATNSSVCCNEDPNPPTTTPVPQTSRNVDDSAGGARAVTASATIMLTTTYLLFEAMAAVLY